MTNENYKISGDELETVFPTANLLQLKNGYRIDIPAPHLKGHIFKTQLKNGMLTITAKTFADNTSFLRTVRLPDMEKTKNIKTQYVQGILSITILEEQKEVNI